MGDLVHLEKWLWLAAILMPVLNACFVRWAHLVAFNRGYLHAGAALGAAFGPAGVGVAALLPRLPFPTMRIAAQLHGFKQASIARWGTGVGLMLLASAPLGYAGLWLVFSFPAGPSLRIIVLAAAVLGLAGWLLLSGGLPPAQLLPPIDDSLQYVGDAEIQADISATCAEYAPIGRAELLRSGGITLLVLAGLSALVAVLLWGDPAVGSLPAVRLTAQLLLGAASLSVLTAIGLLRSGAAQLRSIERSRTVHPAGAYARHEAPGVESAASPSLLAQHKQNQQYVQRLTGAIDGVQRSLKWRGYGAFLAAVLLSLLLLIALEASRGVPWHQAQQLSLGLLAVGGAWVPWLIRRRAAQYWVEAEGELLELRRLADQLNVQRPPEARVSAPALPVEPDTAFDVGWLLRGFGQTSILAALFGIDGSGPPLTGILLGCGLILMLAGTRLIRSAESVVPNDLSEAGGRLAQTAAERAAAAAPSLLNLARSAPAAVPGAEPAAADDSTLRLPTVAELRNEAELEEFQRQYLERLSGLSNNAGVYGCFGYLAIFTFAAPLARYWQLNAAGLPEAEPLYMAAGVLALLALIVMCLRGSLEDRTAALPQGVISAVDERNYVLSGLRIDRLDRQMRFLRRAAWALLWLSGYIGLAWLIARSSGGDAAQLALLAPVCLAGGLGAAGAAALLLLRLPSLHAEVRKSRAYSLRLAQQHARQRLSDIFAQMDPEATDVEDHGHFAVEVPRRPSPAELDAHAAAIARQMVHHDTDWVWLDHARSAAYTLFWLACAAWVASDYGKLLTDLARLLVLGVGAVGLVGGLLLGWMLRENARE